MRFYSSGLDATSPMAHDRDASLRLARGRAIETPAAVGLLDLPAEQCSSGQAGADTIRAWALILLQLGLAILNIRGVAKNGRA
jgi:hypothetical protein